MYTFAAQSRFHYTAPTLTPDERKCGNISLHMHFVREIVNQDIVDFSKLRPFKKKIENWKKVLSELKNLNRKYSVLAKALLAELKQYIKIFEMLEKVEDKVKDKTEEKKSDTTPKKIFNFFSELPDDAFLEAYRYLSTPEKIQISQVSREWRAKLENEVFPLPFYFISSNLFLRLDRFKIKPRYGELNHAKQLTLNSSHNRVLSSYRATSFETFPTYLRKIISERIGSQKPEPGPHPLLR